MAKTLRTITYIIPAGEALDIAIDADYVRVRQSAVALYVENDEGDRVELSEGDDVTEWPIKRLRVSHDSGVAQTVKLTLGKGVRNSSAKVGGSLSIAGGVDVNNFPANNGAVYQTRGSIGNGASVQIRPANLARRYLLIQNNDTSAVMRVRFANAAAADIGLRLGPGDSLEFQGWVPTDAVHCIMETAPAVTYNINYVEG